MKNIWNQIENMYFVLPFTFFKLYQLPLTIILLIHIIIQIHIKLYILIVRKQNFWFIFYPSYDFIIVNQWSICWFVINTFFCPYPTRGEFSVIFHLFIFILSFQPVKMLLKYFLSSSLLNHPSQLCGICKLNKHSICVFIQGTDGNVGERYE